VRYTRYWTIERGTGCVVPAPGGFTRVLANRPGRLRVAAALRPGRLLGDAPACR
jgi:hypothetical protein